MLEDDIKMVSLEARRCQRLDDLKEELRRWWAVYQEMGCEDSRIQMRGILQDVQKKIKELTP